MHLLDWLEAPSNAALLTSHIQPAPPVFEVIRRIGVDYVDGKVSVMGHMLSSVLPCKPWATIATLDTSDFLHCHRAFDLHFNLYDVRTYEKLEL